MKREQYRLGQLLCVLAAAISFSIVSISCDSGGGGGSSSGGSTIMGNVSTFSGNGGAFISAGDETMLARTVRQISDMFVAAAVADAAGVTVSIPALGLDAVTGEDGAFIFTDVPGGSYDIEFSFEGTTVALNLTVPDNAVIELRNVTIDDGSVDVDDVEVTVNDELQDDESEETIVICHRPPGNPDNGQTIKIGVAALDAHLNHGDEIGPCEGDEGAFDDDSLDDGESLDDEESEDSEDEDSDEDSEDGESDDDDSRGGRPEGVGRG